jgi:uncharacterized protein (TIGR00299 family) protein
VLCSAHSLPVDVVEGSAVMIAYLDLPSGLSGDMFLGCLIDAGWPIDRLRCIAIALQIPDDEWAIEVDVVSKAGQRATQVNVLTTDSVQQRRLADVRQMIESATLPRAVKDRSLAVFNRLARAEARVHGTTPDRIHFHEVGAVDALIDIVGVIAGLHELQIESVYASAVPLGSGWTNCTHGPIPLPAPATLELLASAGALTRPAMGPGEWVTPTGAALLAEFAIFERPVMTLRKVGIGAGQRDCEWPNVARICFGESQNDGSMVQLETNIDDMNPQLYAAVSSKLFEAGAKDVWFTPIQMKKNRPAILLSVLAQRSKETTLANVLLRETTTLGVRTLTVEHRHEALREMRAIDTSFGQVRVKIKWLDGEAIGVTPEYDDCLALAESANAPVRIVLDAAIIEAQALLGSLRAASSFQ